MPGIEHAVVRREVVVNTMSSGDESLSQRLGGYDVVAAFMTDYVNRIRGPSSPASAAAGEPTRNCATCGSADDDVEGTDGDLDVKPGEPDRGGNRRRVSRIGPGY
jgi:hypothetical protein